MVFMKSRSLFMECSLSWVYGYYPETKPFRHFPYNENSTRALIITSLKCCLSSTDAINKREKIHACVWGFEVASCKRVSLKSTGFSQKNKVWYFCNKPRIYVKIVSTVIRMRLVCMEPRPWVDLESLCRYTDVKRIVKSVHGREVNVMNSYPVEYVINVIVFKKVSSHPNYWNIMVIIFSS